jgi:hypothetical protein
MISVLIFIHSGTVFKETKTMGQPSFSFFLSFKQVIRRKKKRGKIEKKKRRVEAIRYKRP